LKFLILLSSKQTYINTKFFIILEFELNLFYLFFFFRYIYNGTLHPSKNFKTNIDLLIAADELCLVNLCSSIVECIVEELKKDREYLKSNFVLIQRVATELNHLTTLSQFYNDAFKQNPSLIFEASDFITIDQKFLLYSLIENNHSLKPIKVWDKLLEWCRAQSIELNLDVKYWTVNNVVTFRNLIQPFIEYIDFKNICPSNFFRKVKPYKDFYDDAFYVNIYDSFINVSKFLTKINSTIIDSKIINSEHASFLADFVKRIKKDFCCYTLYEFDLLIRGSDNGFREDSFYDSCEEKGSTITLARVKNTNEILGGFNSSRWKSYGITICNEDNFIFSLDKNNLKNSIFSKVEDVNRAERNVTNKFIPDFGDLCFLIDTKKGLYYKNSYEKLIRSNEGQFEIDDYEVFHVVGKLVNY
jgi:hypothetical protein